MESEVIDQWRILGSGVEPLQGLHGISIKRLRNSELIRLGVQKITGKEGKEQEERPIRKEIKYEKGFPCSHVPPVHIRTAASKRGRLQQASLKHPVKKATQAVTSKTPTLR